MGHRLIYVGHKLLETYPSYTRISWNMVKHCNYNCWYCYDEDNKTNIYDYEQLTYEKVKNLFDNIQLNYSNREYIKLIYTGGEPTILGYKLFDYIHYGLACNNVKEIVLHTNTSKDVKYFEALNNEFKNNSIEINCTCHLDYINDNNIDEFIHKITMLSNIKIYVWIMVSNDNYEKAIKYREIINNYFNKQIANYKYIQHPSTWDFVNDNKLDVVSDKKNVVYKTDRQHCYYNVDEMMIDNKNNYQGMICMRGANQLAIQANGNIYLADCQWYNKNIFLPAPGLYNKNIMLDNNKFITVCNQKYCKHPSDNYIPKYNVNYYLSSIAKTGYLNMNN